MNNFPIPEQDEDLERYTVRCAKTVQGMDPDDFNEAVWATWKRHKGPTDEEKVAAKKFSPDKYQIVPNVCVFAEHETTTAKGEHRKYDLGELVKIVKGNNERISDVGHFPAISDGHTSDPDDPRQREPAICGYAGNYRLGLIGRKNPRWAIFHDEYQLKKAAGTLEQKPRRSVELWTFKDGRAHFDPIAALGAEAPRLPLPQRYSTFEYQGATVERYSCAAGAYTSPAAGNTFVASMGGTKKPKRKKPGKEQKIVDEEFKNDKIDDGLKSQKKKKKVKKPNPDASPQSDEYMGTEKYTETYAAEPGGTATTQFQGEEEMARLAPEDLREIIEALFSTELFQKMASFVDTQEGAGAPPSDDIDTEFDEGVPGEGEDLGGMEEVPEGGEDMDGELGGNEAAMADQTDEEPGAELPAGDEEEETPEPDEDEEKFSMSNGNGVLERYTQLQKSHEATVEKYAALQRSHDEALKDMSKLHGRLQSLERINADHARRGRLLSLREKFGDFIDVDEEGTRCLYSQKADMTDAQFDKYIGDLERFAAKAQKAAVYIPSGDAPKIENDTPEKYAQAKQINARAVQIATEKRNKGEQITYTEAKELARQELAG